MLIVIGAVVAVVTTAIAIFIPWLPAQASVQRERIDFVFWLTTWISVAIFAIVAAVIIYCVFKFRVRPDDDSDGEPIHGHTGLEIAWTAVPAILVLVIGIASAVAVARNERIGPDPLRIDVTAVQFAWRFDYPNGVTSPTLRLPVDRTVLLRLTSNDVIHSFWVPEFGQKQDAVPGIFTSLVITPSKVGRYPLPCTELCGLGHALMRSAAIVMPNDEYESWLATAQDERTGVPPPDDEPEDEGEEEPEGDQEGQQDDPEDEGEESAEAGAALFAENGCGNCHTFAPAGAKATVGPNLGDLPDDEDYVRQSIVEPGAQLAKGYQNIMPPYSQLSDEQLDSLVQYLLRGSK